MAKKSSKTIIEEIHIKGACTNNLKNIELHIPKNKLIVVTGVSGSGKSSLVMDTLYAEGQRRYVESMSSYARQFLGRMKKPEVDFIKGISPAIAIEQKVTTGNARSTVGSLTEIYDYLRLLYARAGETISPVSGQVVKKLQISDIIDLLTREVKGTRMSLFVPIRAYDIKRNIAKELELILQKGFTRVKYKSALINIEDHLADPAFDGNIAVGSVLHDYELLIDRFAINDDTENLQRIADSIHTAFYEGGGECIIELGSGEIRKYNNRFELDGISFVEPTPQLFNYNNPFGACPKCEGYGQIIGLDPAKVIPDPSKSLYEGAIMCWKGDSYGLWKDRFIYAADKFDFPIHTPYEDLTKEQQRVVWTGNDWANGIDQFFGELEEKNYKIQNRVMIARYRGRTTCNLCHGGRLRPEAGYVKISGKTISELIHLPIDRLKEFFDTIALSTSQQQISRRILHEISSRLQVMNDIGLSYLTLDRASATLSGGETQRINLTRTLGSNLTSSVYILDEPSIGLHPRDTAKLVSVLHKLRNLGNTVIVVEHEEEVIRSADFLVDVGPEAGIHGGEIVYAGPNQNLHKASARSLTNQYLTGKKRIEIPHIKRKTAGRINIIKAGQHNLKNINVTIPLHSLTVVAGVSGSGKTSLIKHILYPALLKELNISHSSSIGKYKALEGDIKMIKHVELIDQNPIGRSSRSNPVTYVKAYDEIRKLMVKQQLSKIRGYKPKHFSFNTEGGRCENCKGDGYITIEMQFLSDVNLICEDCNGKRFKNEILEVEYKGKNISQILDLSITDSLSFFAKDKAIISKLKPLDDVGLGYVQLGQSSSTLSGGEAQRVKLASYLSKDEVKQHQLFIFDEPTTGLHFDDTNKLLMALQALIDKGNTVIVIEHNLDVIKCADWLIDLGPEGGDQGGYLIYQGVPEGITDVANSYTGQFLKSKNQSS